MLNLNQKAVSALPMPDMAQGFVADLGALDAGYDRVIELAKYQILEFDTLFASLQHRAFTGRLQRRYPPAPAPVE